MGNMDRYMELLERRSERGPVPIKEQVKVLGEFGITISDKTIAEWGENSAGEYWDLLMTEGWGTYDYDSDTWTPSSNQVYSFDAEVHEISNMYQIYLQGLQSISEGELTFTDITTDYSRVDDDGPGGVIEVRFCLNGEPVRYEARYMGDWLDLHIRDAINQCLEKQGVEKRFYGTDGDQGETILFCTKEWAQAFEEATLCCMSDTAL